MEQFIALRGCNVNCEQQRGGLLKRDTFGGKVKMGLYCLGRGCLMVYVWDFLKGVAVLILQ